MYVLVLVQLFGLFQNTFLIAIIQQNFENIQSTFCMVA